MISKLRTRLVLSGALLGASFVVSASDEAPTLLLRQPAVSRDHIAFVYAGDIWLTDRAGKNAETIQFSTATLTTIGSMSADICQRYTRCGSIEKGANKGIGNDVCVLAQLAIVFRSLIHHQR